MSKTITIYTTNTCAYCVQVKKWLDSKGLGYNVINLDDNPEEMQKMIQLSGQMAVPVTVVAEAGDQNAPKDVTVGWNPAKLAAAIAPMLQAA